MKLFTQRLKDAIPAFFFMVVSLVLIILHQCKIDFSITALGDTATSQDLSLVSLCIGVVIALFIPIIDGGKIRSSKNRKQDKNDADL